MKMYNAFDVLSRTMDGWMQNETGFIHSKIRTTIINNIAFQIHFYQTWSSYFAV